ncbi:MAG: hypothetical protein ACRD63_09695, partial [Pyrinomonadaceae bacterium]
IDVSGTPPRQYEEAQPPGLILLLGGKLDRLFWSGEFSGTHWDGLWTGGGKLSKVTDGSRADNYIQVSAFVADQGNKGKQ